MRETVQDRFERLAGLLADEHGARIVTALVQAVRPDAPDTAKNPQPGGESLIGVWRRTADGGLRRDAGDPSAHRAWADIEYIPGKGAGRRVAVVGESTARGYLLDPGLTPTGLLQNELDRTAGPGRYQCVDLAKTGAGIVDLARVVPGLSALDIDALVLWAGNNWCLHRLTASDGRDLAEALEEGGIAGLRVAFDERIVAPRVKALLHRVTRLAQNGVQITVVVPEFNLVEWEPGTDWQVGVLPAERAAEWHALHAWALSARHDGDWERLVEYCDRMADLDQGSSPVPGRLRGSAQAALGRHAEARNSWEASRDAVTGQLLLHTPRATAMVQDLLCEFARREGHQMVDLRQALADPLTGLPDPEYFLDYCHHSGPGLAVAVRAIAECIAPRPPETRTENSDPSFSGLLDPDCEAVGHLLAACHNAWHGQPDSVLRRHLTAALRDSTGQQAARSLLGWLSSSAPSWTDDDFAALCGHRNADRYLAVNVLRTARALLHTPLPGLLAELTSFPEPISVFDEIGADGTSRMDLLLDRRGDADDLCLTQEAAHYRCAVPEMRTVFCPGGVAQEVRIDLRYRTPHANEDGAGGSLEVNGSVVAEMPASRERWQAISVTVQARSLMELTVRWPVQIQDEPEWRTVAGGALRAGRAPVVTPVHGELFQLDAHWK